MYPSFLDQYYHLTRIDPDLQLLSPVLTLFILDVFMVNHNLISALRFAQVKQAVSLARQRIPFLCYPDCSVVWWVLNSTFLNVWLGLCVVQVRSCDGFLSVLEIASMLIEISRFCFFGGFAALCLSVILQSLNRKRSFYSSWWYFCVHKKLLLFPNCTLTYWTLKFLSSSCPQVCLFLFMMLQFSVLTWLLTLSSADCVTLFRLRGKITKCFHS